MHTPLKIFVAVLLSAILALTVIVATNDGITYEYETDINAPITKSWSIFTDSSLTKEWMSNLESQELMEGRHGEVGSTYKFTFNENGEQIIMTETTTAIIENQTYAFTYDASVLKGDVKVTFSEVNGKTHLHSLTHAKPTTFMFKVFTTFLKGMFEKNNAHQYNKLKELIERSN